MRKKALLNIGDLPVLSGDRFSTIGRTASAIHGEGIVVGGYTGGVIEGNRLTSLDVSQGNQRYGTRKSNRRGARMIDALPGPNILFVSRAKEEILSDLKWEMLHGHRQLLELSFGNHYTTEHDDQRSRGDTVSSHHPKSTISRCNNLKRVVNPI
jgi:hypothetical protein